MNTFKRLLLPSCFALSALAIALVYSFIPLQGIFALYEWTWLAVFLLASSILFFLKRFLKPEINLPKLRLNKIGKWIQSLENKDKREKTYREILALTLMGLFLGRFYISMDYLYEVEALQSSLMAPWEVCLAALFTNWEIGALIFVTIWVFIPSAVFRKIVKFLSTPIVLVYCLFFPFMLQGICGDLSGAGFTGKAFAQSLEAGLLLAFCLDSWLQDPSFKTGREDWYALFVGLSCLLLCTLGDYLPKNLFGLYFGQLTAAKNFNLTHRLFLYLGFLLPAFYFTILFPFDKTHRKAFLYFISAAAFYSYAAIRRQETFTSIYNLPLHLCNTAMYITPFTLLFHSYGLFYFTMFVNVIGAGLAILMPNYLASMPVFSPTTFEFFTNHLYAFFMPILIVLLGVYERPKMKYFWYSMIGFFIYYAIVMWIDIYYNALGVTVDFFFLESTFISDKLGKWATDIYNTQYIISSGGHDFIFRPYYLVLFFLIYVALSFGMWYLYEGLFKAVDSVVELRERSQSYHEGRREFQMNLKNREQTGNPQEDVPSLEIRHVYKRYGKNPDYALEDFSLSLQGGKIYGFLGKNGAGKSTLIKCIVGMHTFQKGQISVCGKDVTYQPVEAKMDLGYVPDNAPLYENLTGRQYISYMASLYRVSPEKQAEREKALLARLEMEKAYDQPISSYSFGMKQKIAIIGALIHEPPVWILDEPMTGLDPNSIFQIKEAMREYARKGKIVFFSSHIIDVVENLCDEVIIIKHGRLVKTAAVEGLSRSGIGLEKLFLTLTAENPEEAQKLEAEEEKKHA
jgi:ABC-2 type transport system ATP-binding protein